MTLLDYSTGTKDIDRLPVTSETPQYLWNKNKIIFWSFLILSIAAAFIYGWFINSEVGFFLTAVAFIPLTVLVALSLLLTPRSEVSLPLRFVVLLWGGIGATNLTLLIVGLLTQLFGSLDLNGTVVIQAAIVEESCKGLILFGLFCWFKHLVRTPLAGATLGLLVGAGFAFIENIMYFNNAYIQGGWNSLWATVALRAGMSFFLHAMATTCTGLFIGYVVSKRTQLNIWKKFIFLDMGLLSAMTVHGMWNGFASLFTDNSKFAMVYLFFWVPFVTLVGFILFHLRGKYSEAKTTTVISAARRGYIKMSQAERITDKKERRTLYRTSDSAQIALWESSLLRIQFWNDSLTAAKKDRKIRRLNKLKSKDMLKLAQVVTKV